MRVLITGGTGMLGKDFISYFLQNEENEVFTIQRNNSNWVDNNSRITSFNFDLTNFSLTSKYLKEIKPDLIIHCAAIVNVDSCEMDYEKADNLHSNFLDQIAACSPSSKLIYISSDSVFDGINGNYKENDATNPVNYYAQSKVKGEEKALLHFENSIVVRTNIYGFHHTEQTSLAEWAINNFSVGKSIGGFSDVLFNPLYTKQVAEVIGELLNKDFKGIINAASNTFISKYDFLKVLAITFGYNPNLVEEKSVKSIDFKAKRPNNTTLNTHLLSNVIGFIPDFNTGLNNFHSDYLEYKNKK